MEWIDVYNQLNDIPTTFKRSGSTYQWFLTSFVNGQFLYTNGSDGLLNQTNFANTFGPWLDFWGKLFGVVRLNNELDASYLLRIQATVLMHKGPPNAIINYLYTSFGLSVTVSDSPASVGWALIFDTTVVNSQVNQILSSLSTVRPAGVPITSISVVSGGGILGTVNYLNAYRTTGSYLISPLTTITNQVPASANNTLPILPTVFLSDPILNTG